MKTRYELNIDGKIVALATDCIECNGDGCESCDKMGFITTENGAQILALVYDVLIKK